MRFGSLHAVMALLNKKKLLVLDVNGLLVDTYYHREKDLPPGKAPDATIGNFFVYKRPFCDEFLQFCLEKFVVGIWSSARKHNVDKLVEYLFQGAKDQLAFLWNQADCTDSGLRHPENKHKPVFLKELSKVWEMLNGSSQHLEAGEYGPTNTLLVDDSSYKAIRNPPYTAIFPLPYTAHDLEDSSLSGGLRKYLEGLCSAVDVQGYVKENPFGEPSITVESPSWNYYKDALKVDDVHSLKVVKLVSLLETPSLSEDMVADNGRMDTIKAPDSDNIMAATSTEQVSLEAFVQTNIEVFSSDQRKQGEEGNKSYGRPRQVDQASEKTDMRITGGASGDYLASENSFREPSYKNSYPDKRRKWSTGSWRSFPNTSQNWTLHGTHSPSGDGNLHDEGNCGTRHDLLFYQTACPDEGDKVSPHVQRDGYYTESQRNRQGKRKELDPSRNMSNLTPIYGEDDQSIYAGAYSERFPGKISHRTRLNHLPGHLDHSRGFHSSCGTHVFTDAEHVNQARSFNSIHNTNHTHMPDSPGRCFGAYQNKLTEFDRSYEHAIGNRSWHEHRYDSYKGVKGNVALPMHMYGSKNVTLPMHTYGSHKSFRPRPPVSGMTNSSRYHHLGHENNQPLAISGHMEDCTKGSNSNRRHYDYTPPSARFERPPPEGHQFFSSRFHVGNERMTQAHGQGNERMA